MKSAAEYNEAGFTANADDLFDCGWDTATLAYMLADVHLTRTDRAAFLAEYNTGESGWVRGVICKALDDMGDTVRRINIRKS